MNGGSEDKAVIKAPHASAVPQWLPPNPWAVKAHPWVLGAFCVAMAWWWMMRETAAKPGLVEPRWLGPLWLSLLVATTLTGMAKYLPLQQVVAGYFQALAIYLPFWWLSLVLSTGGFRTRLGLHEILIFPAVLFIARGLAKLILAPVRGHSHYGSFTIVLGAFLTWMVNPAPASSIAFAAAMIMLASNAWLISKHPYSLPLDLQPLVVWSLLSVYHIRWNIEAEMITAATLGLIFLVLATVFALRGWAQHKLKA